MPHKDQVAGVDCLTCGRSFNEWLAPCFRSHIEQDPFNSYSFICQPCYAAGWRFTSSNRSLDRWTFFYFLPRMGFIKKITVHGNRVSRVSLNISGRETLRIAFCKGKRRPTVPQA